MNETTTILLKNGDSNKHSMPTKETIIISFTSVPCEGKEVTVQYFQGSGATNKYISRGGQ